MVLSTIKLPDSSVSEPVDMLEMQLMKAAISAMASDHTFVPGVVFLKHRSRKKPYSMTPSNPVAVR